MQYFARSTSYEESEPKADTETEDREKERPKVDDTEEKGYAETSSEPYKIPEEVEADASQTEPATNMKQKR